MEKKEAPQKKRKKPYKAGLAQVNFKPQHDWEIEEAREKFLNSKFPIEVDKINYCDCIDGMKKLPENSIDLIIADPPFGIKFDRMGSQYNRNDTHVVKGYQEIEGKYNEFTMSWMSELTRIMKETSSAYIFSGWTNLIDVLEAAKKANLTLINHIIWKYQFGVFTKNKFVSSHYHVLFLVKNANKYFFNKIEHYPLDIWDIPRVYIPREKKNSTKLPEDVVIRCINFSSKPGDLVFDPFMGNGTTATCAKLTFRHYCGFEINKNMQEIIEDNINSVNLGEKYKPYYTYLPSLEELTKKYPAVRDYLKNQKN